MTVIVRHVYENNLVYEFDLIRQSLMCFPYVSMDMEFPGIVFHPDGVPVHLCSTLNPRSFYALLKRNVDATSLIQVGLTLSDADGNLPTLGTSLQFVWEFNFKDFDYEVDLHNPDSISLLQSRGIDFAKNKKMGIDSRRFASLFIHSGLGPRNYPHVTWVTFHGPYDFGFLIKILTGKLLPEDVNEFLCLVKIYFGPTVYDIKTMIGLFGLHGGLERVAKSLHVDPLRGQSQSGSGSWLTMQVFLTLRKRFNDEKIKTALGQLNHAIYGLTSML